MFQQLQTRRLNTQQPEDEDDFEHIPEHIPEHILEAIPQTDGPSYERWSTEDRTSTEQELLEDNPWDCAGMKLKSQDELKDEDSDSDGEWVEAQSQG